MRTVIKIGSSLLTTGNSLDESRIGALGRDISEVHSMRNEVIVVSSGAVAAGMKKLGLKRKPSDIRHKQAAASVGQSTLMWAYEKSFSIHGKKVAQILLTRDAFYDRARYINAKNTILTLLDYSIIPIINENDSVAIDEIKFGDNDQLASLVAGLVDADRLVILSDVDGLYTRDPRRYKGARLIPVVERITPEIEALSGGTGSLVGTGGMYSKLLAAKRAVQCGIRVNIISGKVPGLLPSLFHGNPCGTEFKPGAEKIPARKGWIAFGLRARGSIMVDDGAKDAILSRGKSLLPSGIISIEGSFKAGDAVYCTDTGGNRFAKGLTNYSSEEVGKLKGLRTSEIEKTLGYRYSDEVIHRDNLVLLQE
ncbi:MAG: glutamate 5-kinase [Nitrospirota bacterium]|nr:glutamate 5-kinase [Nitrospirota bacterium]